MKNITYVNAGAGSGKTFHLISRFTELVAAGKARPDEVMMTTFSEKAAAEIKARANEALIAKGMTEASLMLEHAAVGTVHGLAYRFIRKYWFRLGLTPDMKVMDDEARGIYVSQSLANLPTMEEVAALHDFAREFQICDAWGRADFNFWHDQLRSIIDLSSSYEITDFSASRAESLSFAHSLFDPSASCRVEEDDLVKAIDELCAFAECEGGKEEALAALRSLRASVGKRSLRWYGQFVKQSEGLAKRLNCGWVAEVVSAAASVARSEYAYGKVRSYINLIFSLAERWRGQYADFKKKRNVLDYEDLELLFLQLLNDPTAADDVAASFKYIFVDEYQDCSPIQVKIFDRLSDLVTRSFWVGDMKQAIYAFRGSATELTRAVMGKIAHGEDGCSQETLGKSWRSLPPIVDVCNKFFTKVYDGIMPASSIVLEYQDKGQSATGPSLRYWDLSMCKNKERKAERIAAQVADMVAKGVLPEDIAIIGRTNSDLDGVSNALNELGLPTSLAQQDVTALAATDLLLAALSVVLSPRDSLAKATVAHLTAPGYTLEKIMNAKMEWDADPDNEYADFLEEVDLVAQLIDDETRRRCMGMSVASLVEAIVIETGMFDLVKGMPNPQAQESCLLALIQTAQKFEDGCLANGCPATIPSFIYYVRAAGIMCGGDREGVQLVTYHGSKGLQWRHVILISLDENPLDEKKLIRREVFGTHKGYVEPPSPDNLYPEVFLRVCPWLFGADKTVKDDFVLCAIESSEAFNDAYELARMQAANLLYVGMTRPSETLILTLGKGKSPLAWAGCLLPGQSLPGPDGDLLATGDVFADCSLADSSCAVTPLPDPQKAAPRVAVFKADAFAALSPRRDISPSGVEGFGRVLRSKVIANRIPLAHCDDDAMTVVGNCIHHVFSLSDGCPSSEFVSLASTIVDNYGLADAISSPQLICEAWDRLAHALAETFGPAKEVVHERPFSASINGFCVTGSMDLVWVTEGGDVLVDFKSCPLSPDVVLDCADDHYVGLYAGQLDSYAAALEAAGETVVARLIFYPVSGLLVELGRSEVPILANGLGKADVAQPFEDIKTTEFNIACGDFNLRKLVSYASKEGAGDSISVIDAIGVEDEDDFDEDEDGLPSANGGNAAIPDYVDNFDVIAFVDGQSSQGVYISRHGGDVRLLVPCLGSAADCSIAFDLLVAFKRHFFPADIFFEGSPLNVDWEELYGILLGRNVANADLLLNNADKLLALRIMGLNRSYYIKPDFLKRLYPRSPMLSLSVLSDFAEKQWVYLDYHYANRVDIGRNHGPLRTFCVLRNGRRGTIVDNCDAVVLMLHETPIYVRNADFLALTQSNPFSHVLDGCQVAVDRMPSDEWENLCLSVACGGNSRPATCLLLWNSENHDGSFSNPAELYVRSARTMFFFWWHVRRFVDVKLGDIVYLVDVSSSGGVLLRGEVINEPYVDRKMPNDRYGVYIDAWIRSTGPEGETAIPLQSLKKLVGNVDLECDSTSFVKLDNDQAARLGDAWSEATS